MTDTIQRPQRSNHPAGRAGHEAYKKEKAQYLANYVPNQKEVLVIEGPERVVEKRVEVPVDNPETLAALDAAKKGLERMEGVFAKSQQVPPENPLEAAPTEHLATFNEYTREDLPFGERQKALAAMWQGLKAREGSTASDGALEPLGASEVIKLDKIHRAIEWGKTKIIEVVK